MDHVAPERTSTARVARPRHGPDAACTAREATARPRRNGTWRGTGTTSVTDPWLSVVATSVSGRCPGTCTTACTRASST